MMSTKCTQGVFCAADLRISTLHHDPSFVCCCLLLHIEGKADPHLWGCIANIARMRFAQAHFRVVEGFRRATNAYGSDLHRSHPIPHCRFGRHLYPCRCMMFDDRKEQSEHMCCVSLRHPSRRFRYPHSAVAFPHPVRLPLFQVGHPSLSVLSGHPSRRSGCPHSALEFPLPVHMSPSRFAHPSLTVVNHLVVSMEVIIGCG